MSPKACCSGIIRIRVLLLGVGNLCLDDSNCDLGFGDPMFFVILGLSLAIVVSLCFGAIVALGLNLSLAIVLKLILVAAMTPFESLASYLR